MSIFIAYILKNECNVFLNSLMKNGTKTLKNLMEDLNVEKRRQINSYNYNNKKEISEKYCSLFILNSAMLNL